MSKRVQKETWQIHGSHAWLHTQVREFPKPIIRVSWESKPGEYFPCSCTLSPPTWGKTRAHTDLLCLSLYSFVILLSSRPLRYKYRIFWRKLAEANDSRPEGSLCWIYFVRPESEQVHYVNCLLINTQPAKSDMVNHSSDQSCALPSLKY